MGPECSDTETKVNYIKVLSDVPNNAMPCIPLLLLQENPPASWITIMRDDFEGVFPSGSWRTSGDPYMGVSMITCLTVVLKALGVRGVGPRVLILRQTII